jgi:exoribonuclease-2
MLSTEAVTARVAEGDEASLAIRKAERASNLHWKLVYLANHPQWRGRCVVVENSGPKCTVVIPELALETRLRFRAQPALNAEYGLRVREVDLPDLAAYFRIERGPSDS